MKKYLGLIITLAFVLLPLTVNALPEIDYTCQSNGDSTKTCVINYDFDEELDTAEVTLTEGGGATINSIESAGSDWTVIHNKEGSTWTVVASSPGVEGTGQLFKFTYTVSGTEDCEIVIAFNGATKTIVEEPEPEEPDTPTPQKQTGSSLPFIALGAIAIASGSLYISTKNKAKMYRL